MSGPLAVIQRFDLAVYGLVNRVTGNWFLDRIAVNQERTQILKGGIFFAAYWWLWFRPGPDVLEERRKTIIAIIFGTLFAITCVHFVTAITPYRTRPMYNEALAHHYSIPIPENFAQWTSFPSDTAAYFCALAFGLAYLSRRYALAFAAYAAVWICLPRIYLGIHYASDIVVGALIGIGAVWMVLKLDAQHSRPAALVMKFMNSKPHVFYTIAFLISFEMASVFGDTQKLLHVLYHAALQFQKAFGLRGTALAALVLAIVATACIRFAQKEGNRAREA